MKIGDLVRVPHTYTSHEVCEGRIAMIVEGPNEVGKVRLLLSDGSSIWRHSTEVEYLPKEGVYLKK